MAMTHPPFIKRFSEQATIILSAIFQPGSLEKWPHKGYSEDLASQAFQSNSCHRYGTVGSQDTYLSRFMAGMNVKNTYWLLESSNNTTKVLLTLVSSSSTLYVRSSAPSAPWKAYVLNSDMNPSKSRTYIIL